MASICDLPPSLLAKIFAYLPFKDRHQLCLVSSTWAAASRIPWSDVTFLDLSTIPFAMLDSILELCPNLQELCAKNLTINLVHQAKLQITANLHTMKLRSVKFALKNSNSQQSSGGLPELLELFSEFFSRFPNLTELTWHDVSLSRFADTYRINRIKLPSTTAASIRRLIMVSSERKLTDEWSVHLSWYELINLESLYSVGTSYNPEFESQNLREACVDSYSILLLRSFSLGKLPNLEVLVFASPDCLSHRMISPVLQTCPTLRIFAFAGKDNELALEQLLERAMKRLPLVTLPSPATGERSALQPLDIFVGGDIATRVRFTVPKNSDSVHFWRIDCPMLDFLAKPDVLAVFKDTWVAKVIREGPENGLLPWGSPDQTELFYSTLPLNFC